MKENGNALKGQKSLAWGNALRYNKRIASHSSATLTIQARNDEHSLNHDFHKIKKIFKIKNIENNLVHQENLNKILVQDKKIAGQARND